MQPDGEWCVRVGAARCDHNGSGFWSIKVQHTQEKAYIQAEANAVPAGDVKASQQHVTRNNNATQQNALRWIRLLACCSNIIVLCHIVVSSFDCKIEARDFRFSVPRVDFALSPVWISEKKSIRRIAFLVRKWVVLRNISSYPRRKVRRT